MAFDGARTVGATYTDDCSYLGMSDGLNTASAIGPVNTCRSMQVGDTFAIDVVVQGIPNSLSAGAAFDLPILFLCDTPGIMVGPEVEKTALVRHASRLFVVGASLTVPFFTIVQIGRAHV